MKDKNLSLTSTDVCGDWEHFTFKIADADDETEVGKIIQHLRGSYYLEEPCHKYLGWCETKAADLDLIVKSILPHKLSLVAIDKDTNEVAGIRIGLDGHKRLDITKLPLKSPHLHKIFKLKNVLVERAPESPYWNEFNTEDFVAAFLTSVDAKYRGKGLASEMLARYVNLVRSNGFTIMKSYFSSPITRKISWNLGYREISRVYFHELVGFDDGGDTPDFVNAEPGEFANLMYFKI